MSKPFIAMFVGIPGSGKTTFAKQLAERTGAVLLNSDALRLSMWQTLDAMRAARKTSEERKVSNQLSFGAMNYAARQILLSRYSVIYDCNANRTSERQEKRDIAEQTGALSLIVRIKVPYETSLERVQTRDETHDQRRMTPEQAVEFLQHHSDEIEEPTPDEHVIEINGELPFEEQYAIFQQKLGELQYE